MTYPSGINEKKREGYIIRDEISLARIGYFTIIDKVDTLEIDINIFSKYQCQGYFKEVMPKILALYPHKRWEIKVYKFNEAWPGIKKLAEINGFKYIETPFSLDHKMIRQM